MRSCKAAAIAVGLFVAPGWAGVNAHFGFEGINPGTLDGPIVLQDGGVTVEISTIGGSIVGDADTPGLPGAWNTQSLALDHGSMVITFIDGASGFSIELGDFGGDEDLIAFQVFGGPGGTGALIDTGSYYWNGDLSTATPERLAWSYPGGPRMIGSIVLRSNTDDGGLTLLYDNLTVSVPGPAGLPMLACGGLLARGRSRRR